MRIGQKLFETCMPISFISRSTRSTSGPSVAIVAPNRPTLAGGLDTQGLETLERYLPELAAGLRRSNT